jgi:hypothetical protein
LGISFNDIIFSRTETRKSDFNFLKWEKVVSTLSLVDVHQVTGDFGGNKILMTSLQMLAADLAGVDTLIFHNTDDSHFNKAKEIIITHWDEQVK